MHGDETGHVSAQIQRSELFFFSLNPPFIITQRENFSCKVIFKICIRNNIHHTFDCLNQRCYLKISRPPAPGREIQTLRK